MALTYDGTSGITFNDGSKIGSASSLGMRNKIINGAMTIDQRNNGAVNTPASSYYSIDRFQNYQSQSGKFTVQQVTSANTAASNYEANSAPVGFRNSMKVVSTAATSVGSGDYYEVWQRVEGYNIADLGLGTATASNFTVSFWVKSSVTGVYGITFKNGTQTRNYPSTYTINSANTWEYKTITIPGETTGTWITDNGFGLAVLFVLGEGSAYQGPANAWSSTNYDSATGTTNLVSTNAATWYMTGLQLEKGSVATPFEYRPYTTELALCQRYYYRLSCTSSTDRFRFFGPQYNATVFLGSVIFPVTMRVAPTGIEYSTASGWGVNGASTCTAVALDYSSTYQCNPYWTVSGGTSGYSTFVTASGAGAYIGFTGAEL